MNIRSLMTTDALPVETTGKLWAIYLESFAAGEKRCVQQQICYDAASFAAAADDPEYRKFIVTDGDEPVGFVFATNVPEKAGITYVNPAYLRAKFPVEIDEGRFWYFTAISVSPQSQRSGAFEALIAEITAFIDSTHGVVYFDTSDESRPIAKMIEGAIYRAYAQAPHRTSKVGLERMGGQSYWRLTLHEPE